MIDQCRIIDLPKIADARGNLTFVEADRKVAKVLRGNLERFGSGDRITLEESSVARFSLKGEFTRRSSTAGATYFDVIFHDPPFEANSQSDLQSLLALVRPTGWLFHERGDDEVYRPSGLEPADRRRYGTTRFLIFRR